MSDAFGVLRTVDEDGLTIVIPTAGTYVKWPHFSTGRQGPVDLIEVDAANNQFKVGPNGAGLYRCTVAWSGFGSPQTEVMGAVHINGVFQEDLLFGGSIGGAKDMGTGLIINFATLVVGDIIDLRFTIDSNNKEVTSTELFFVLSSFIRSLEA